MQGVSNRGKGKGVLSMKHMVSLCRSAWYFCKPNIAQQIKFFNLQIIVERVGYSYQSAD